jgi:peptide chain release factor 2
LAQALGKERTQLEGVVHNLTRIKQGVEDTEELLTLSVEEDDEDSVESIASDLAAYE